MFCEWIGGFLDCYLENLQIYKELGYTYIHLQLTPYRRVEKINSDLQVDSWIFGFLLLFKTSTNLQGIANG